MINCKCGAGWSSRFSDWATGWTVQGSNSSKGKRFFYSRNRPERLWGPPGLRFSANRPLLSLGNAKGCETSYVHQHAEVKNGGSVPPLLCPVGGQLGFVPKQEIS